MYTPPAWPAGHPGPYTTLGDPGMPPHARRGHLVGVPHRHIPTWTSQARTGPRDG